MGLLELLIVILVIMWLVGGVGMPAFGHSSNNLVHILLIIVIIFVLFGWRSGRWGPRN